MCDEIESRAFDSALFELGGNFECVEKSDSSGKSCQGYQERGGETGRECPDRERDGVCVRYYCTLLRMMV